MSKRKIKLVVTFKAVYQGDEYVPFEYAETKEEMELVIPGLDPKFVVLPKILEGITDKVISAHNEQIAIYFNKKMAEELQSGQLGLFATGKVKESDNGIVHEITMPGPAEPGDEDSDIELTADEAKEVYEEFAA